MASNVLRQWLEKFIAVLLTAAVILFAAPAAADPEYPGGPDFPCGSPLTIPEPQFFPLVPMDGETGVSNTRPSIILSMAENTDIRFLKDVQLIPAHGEIIDVPILPGLKATDSLPGIRSHVEIPIPQLTLNTTYIIVVRNVDPDSPPKCPPAIQIQAIGLFSTAVR